jgi:hypothetical protein
MTLDGNLTNAAIPNDGEYVVITSSKPCVYRWDFKTGVIDEFEFNNTPLAVEFSKDNFTLAVSDSLNRVIVYDADVMERKFILKSHRAPVTALAFVQEDKFLLSASMDTEITKWNMETGERVNVFKGHMNSISSMIVSPDDLVISASDEAIIVWNLNGVMMYKMDITDTDAGRIVSLYISSDSRYLIALQEARANYWQMDNLSIMFQTNTMEPGHYIAVSRDERFVALAEGSTIFIEENALNASSIRIVGKSLTSQIPELHNRESRKRLPRSLHPRVQQLGGSSLPNRRVTHSLLQQPYRELKRGSYMFQQQSRLFFHHELGKPFKPGHRPGVQEHNRRVPQVHER